MGVYYGIRCPECGNEFSHYAGVGSGGAEPLTGPCRPLDPCACPCCGHVFSPAEDNFKADVIAHGLW